MRPCASGITAGFTAGIVPELGICCAGTPRTLSLFSGAFGEAKNDATLATRVVFPDYPRWTAWRHVEQEVTGSGLWSTTPQQQRALGAGGESWEASRRGRATVEAMGWGWERRAGPSEGNSVGGVEV